MWPVSQRSAALRPAPHRQYAPEPDPNPGRAGLYEGEPENCRRDPRRFLPVMAHLGLLLAVFKTYRIEGRAFQMLVAIALAVLPIHYLLPYRLKKPLFVTASMLGMAWVFGIETAVPVLALAALLIGVCYLRISWAARASIVAASAAVMALARSELVPSPLPDNVWPVLGTMMMFRMMIYLYELKHAKKPESLVDTLGYFFLLPNYCFLHFPVVDYRTLQRGYFSKEIHATQQAGLAMMLRGTIHLVLYRLIYHEVLISPAEVHDAASLALFLVANYLLYLRVSGQFHLACGMLHLFGFSLPETHHHYLLAESFTDYWRRINIYWKDFMVRIAFNPVVFRLKRRPQPVALAVATLVVFALTWSLHAYQSFWLRGSWGFSGPDALFWGILGGLVLVNVQFDARKTRGRAIKGATWAFRPLALRSLRTAATFTTIAVLWSLWSSPSVSDWVGLMRRGLQL